MPTPEDIGRFFDHQKQKVDKCLHPSMNCPKPAIRAHSIQNARVLDILHENGHVIMPQLKFSKETGPGVEFALIGRNNASTFTGLCAEHDAELFRPLDVRPLDLADSEQKNLLAMRAVLRELHTCIEAGVRIQVAYQDRVKRGIDPKNQPSEAGIEAIGQMLKAWRVHRFLTEYFYLPLIENRNFSVEHDVIELNGQRPAVAASTFFDVSSDHKDDIVGPTLNIIPVTQDKTVILFSYIAEHKRKVRGSLKDVSRLTGALQKLEISRILLQHAENFVLSPVVYNSWPVGKKQRVLEAFKVTLLSQKELIRHPALMLF